MPRGGGTGRRGAGLGQHRRGPSGKTGARVVRPKSCVANLAARVVRPESRRFGPGLAGGWAPQGSHRLAPGGSPPAIRGIADGRGANRRLRRAAPPPRPHRGIPRRRPAAGRGHSPLGGRVDRHRAGPGRRTGAGGRGAATRREPMPFGAAGPTPDPSGGIERRSATARFDGRRPEGQAFQPDAPRIQGPTQTDRDAAR